MDAHHIEHWARGGKTKLSNLVTLCRLHHRLVHEGEILIETRPEGGWRFLHPDGRHFEVIRCTRVTPEAWNDYGVAPNAAATRWCGERMDYDLGVWVLCNQEIRARRAANTPADVAAETSPGFKPDRAEQAACAGQAAHAEHAARVAAETCLVPKEPEVPWWKVDYERLGYRVT